MPIRNQNWYNLQSTRRYPLDDKTTGDDDSGNPIRDDIVVDCHIRYPSSLGQYLFIQGLNVTHSLVGVVIGAAQTLEDTNCPTVAVVTVQKPVNKNVNYSVTPLVAGLSGWITFGSGVDVDFVGRYSTPLQTFIGQRNARPYMPLPVPSLGKDGVAEYLQGIIEIVAESPVIATYHEAYTLPKYDPETDTTNSFPVQAIVFSTEAPTAQFNPQKFFLAPCNERPESGTCKTPPIEKINGVEPNCETGNIDIIFNTPLQGVPFEQCGGLDILTDRGLTASCARVPDSEKKRKDDCPCDNDDGVSEYCWPELPDPDDPNACEEFTGSICAPLPVCVSFNNCVECDSNETITTTEFDTVAGSFSHATILAPPICCPNTGTGLSNHGVWLSTNNASINIALYQSCAGDWAYGKVVSAEVRPRPGGLQQNGGVILNYVRVTEDGRCRTKYFAVLLDSGAAELQLYRFDGSLLIKENAIPVASVVGNWYRVSAYATGSGGTATITANLHNITTNTAVATLTTSVTNYEVINGRSGVIANSSSTYFNKFEIAEL